MNFRITINPRMVPSLRLAIDLCIAENMRMSINSRAAVDLRLAINPRIALNMRGALNLCLAINPRIALNMRGAANRGVRPYKSRGGHIRLGCGRHKAPPFGCGAPATLGPQASLTGLKLQAVT